MNCSSFQQELDKISQNKSVHFNISMRDHVDNCTSCWNKLVALRWEMAEDTLDLLELKGFLGPDFIYGCDSSWSLANEWNLHNRTSNDSILDFYRNTKWYVYNLSLWTACGQRPNYISLANELLRNFNITSLLDYGSGIGTDALEFASLGFDVETIEINKWCNSFLKWRIERRNIDIDMHAEPATIVRDFDLLWCMDVIEHLQDPIASLSPLLRKCRLFIYDSEFDGNSGGRHPFHFRHDERKLKEAWHDLGFGPVKRSKMVRGFTVYARG